MQGELSRVESRFARLPRGGVNPLRRLRLAVGTIRDYDRLARFHYRAGRPATFVHVLTLADPAEGELAGVLVVSMPTLDSAWREQAWPGRFRTGDRRLDARRINRDLRTISRVVVDPRWRGLGVATRIVRAYLCNPLTPCTEAVAAMGVCCPFFERAGMRAHPPTERAEDERLHRALGELGLRLESLAGRRAIPRPAVRLLRIWARSSKATRSLVALDARTLARAVRLHVSCRPVGYSFGE